MYYESLKLSEYYDSESKISEFEYKYFITKEGDKDYV